LRLSGHAYTGTQQPHEHHEMEASRRHSTVEEQVAPTAGVPSSSVHVDELRRWVACHERS